MQKSSKMSCFLALPLVLSLLAVSVFSPKALANVWETKQAWDDNSEKEFGEYIKHLPMDVFTRADSPYKGIPTDCADAVYLLRVIFAYEHGLPIAFHDKELNNANPAYDAVEAGLPRLRKFLARVRENVNTRSLVDDTYPVEINRKYLRAGTLFVHPQSGKDVPLTYRAGHVYYIQNLYENGMVRYFSSTVPTMVRDLQPHIDITFAPFTKEGGFRAWKHPGSGDMPGYSEEQFALAGWRKNAYRDGDLWEKWSKAIRQRLALRASTPEEEMRAAAENVRGYIKERINLVNKSWALFNSKYGGTQCMNASDYDSYSTPTRDVKIQNELQALRDASVRYLRAQGSSGSDAEVGQLFSQFTFMVLPGTKIDANQLWTAFQTEVVIAISEPEHSPEVRWGLERQDRWPCPQRARQYVGGELANQ